MKRWLLAVLVAAVALPLVAQQSTGAQLNGASSLQIVLWQDIDSPTELALSVRPEDGRWDDLGTVPVELARVNSSRSYRYGDLGVGGVELRVWQPASRGRSPGHPGVQAAGDSSWPPQIRPAPALHGSERRPRR